MTAFQDAGAPTLGLSVKGLPNPIPIAGRPAELARLLIEHRGGLTRLEMIRREHFALGLDAPSIVRRLRKQLVPVESIPEKGEDRSGRPVTFVRYRLSGFARLVPPSGEEAAR